MDFVSFTLFFMAFLLTFQGNAMGRSATSAEIEASLPEKCKKDLDSIHYCTEKPTAGYPSYDELRRLYFANIHHYGLRPRINETRDRFGTNICKGHDYLLENVYVIRDVHNETRYALHIPGVYEIKIHVSECKPTDNGKLVNGKKIKCEQKSFQYPYIVLSRDKRRLESVRILGLHSSCEPELV